MGGNLSRSFVTGRASSLYVVVDECWYAGGDLSRALQVLRAVQTGQFVGQPKFCRPTWRAECQDVSIQSHHSHIQSVLTVADFLIACSRRPMFFMSPTKTKCPVDLSVDKVQASVNSALTITSCSSKIQNGLTLWNRLT